MIGDNDYYGHAAILRAWAGVSSANPLCGRLQHGWTPGPGLYVDNLAEPWAKFLWSRRNLDQCAAHRLSSGDGAAGVPGVEAIGAPFLYLPQTPSPKPQPNSLLVFPFHGWERASVAGDFARYADVIAALGAAGAGYTDITVCLYWLEYDDPALRAIFERRGWQVVTNGARDGNPRFLHKQRDLLLRHSAVTSNRICTATFYALASERPFFLYGPVMGLSGTDDPDGRVFDAWQREAFPTLCPPSPMRAEDAAEASRHDHLWPIGRDELGAEFVLTPTALRRRMGWSGYGRLRAPFLRAWPWLWRQVQRGLR